jgi:hypothetical protein
VPTKGNLFSFARIKPSRPAPKKSWECIISGLNFLNILPENSGKTNLDCKPANGAGKEKNRLILTFRPNRSSFLDKFKI